MNVKHLLIAIVGVAMVREISQADSPAPPRAYVTASRLGRYFFKMIPEKWHREGDKYFVDRAAFGVAYEVDPEGEFKEIWRTSGWYCFEAFLSEDGKYLVRMGPWNGGREPAKGDLAVAFYENGKLLKEYSTADLVDDTS